MEERFLDQEFQTITEDIITHPLFLQLRQLQHHGGENNLYDHSVDTAACAYRMARRFHMREDRVRAVTRAALLHDFCGYDWRGGTYKRFISGYSGLPGKYNIMQRDSNHKDRRFMIPLICKS